MSTAFLLMTVKCLMHACTRAHTHTQFPRVLQRCNTVVGRGSWRSVLKDTQWSLSLFGGTMEIGLCITCAVPLTVSDTIHIIEEPV